MHIFHISRKTNIEIGGVSGMKEQCFWREGEVFWNFRDTMFTRIIKKSHGINQILNSSRANSEFSLLHTHWIIVLHWNNWHS
jgi:hypothetical protein